ncbi:MAG: DUF2851 family protein [Verrucomicrobiales bacterium]|jgi:hypothetical protein|nr:DUF2851 family protein [Verrucomicrobiales bacterium]
MNYRDWRQYNRNAAVVKEDSAPDEAFMQRLWFEELYHNPLTLTDGRRVRVLQPGFWNRGAGPDFFHAAIEDADGRLHTGAVELDLGSAQWRQHRHADNARYDQVILQVVWRAGAREFFPATVSGSAVPQAELSSQLKFPLAELREYFTATVSERELGARLGRCGAALAAADAAAVLEMLRAAGEFRFAQKQKLFALRAAALGEEQALWLGIAEALGYAQNRDAMRGLAQRLTVSALRAADRDRRREALLFGVAGFMPGERLPERLAASAYVRGLWDEWWQHRAAWQERIIPRDLWRLAGVRPLNRPERRVALLARLAAPSAWRRFIRLARSGDAAPLRDFFAGLTHDFWDCHCTLASAPSASAGLLGDSRLAALLFNTVWPLAAARHPDAVLAQLRAAAAGTANRHAKIAAGRLLGNRRVRGLAASLLAQEGLLQIYRDFCLQDYTRCRDCTFPELAAARDALAEHPGIKA